MPFYERNSRVIGRNILHFKILSKLGEALLLRSGIGHIGDLMSNLTGKTILHYKILKHVGRGGMGVVYKALDTKLDREVALIVLIGERWSCWNER